MDRKLKLVTLWLLVTTLALGDQNFYSPTTQQTGSFTIQSGVPLQGTWVFASGSTLDVTNATKIGFPSGGSGAVSSVFGRTGAVVATTGDYTFSQIGSTPTTLAGYGITDAQPLNANLTTWATKTPYAGNVTVSSGKTLAVSGGLTLNPSASNSTLNIVGSGTFSLDGGSGATKLIITSNKTATFNNTLTFQGTDSSTLNIGTGGTLGSAAFTASNTYEPALGNPTSGTQILSSTSLGVRSWITIPSSFFDGRYVSLDFTGSNITSIATRLFSSLQSIPTTVAGYGITDVYTKTQDDANFAPISHTHSFASLTSKPTTLAGYGITDAEPALGNPTTNGYILSSTTTGTRSWIAPPVPGGSGTVTSFSSGDLSPLFTTSVANAASTPALSFSLTSAAGNTWFGNASGLSGAPAYNVAGDLTRTNDTNVTLTLTGTPTNALLRSVGMTLGWTGTLATSRGGTGASTPSAGLANLGGEPALGNPGTSGFVLSSTTGGTRSWVAQTTPFNPNADQNFGTSQTVNFTDAGTNNGPNVITIVHNSSATPVTGYGTAFLFRAKSDTVNSQNIGQVDFLWTDPTDATRTSKARIRPALNGALQNGLQVFASGAIGVNTTVDAGVSGVINLASGGGIRINNVPYSLDDVATTTTNDTPAAGDMGERVASAITFTSAVSYTTNQTKNLTSISLTGGDWDVRGIVTFNVASVPANIIYQGQANTSTTTGTLTDDGYQSAATFTALQATASNGSFSCALPPRRVSLSTTTSVFLVAKAPAFTGGTCTASGYIEARRTR